MAVAEHDTHTQEVAPKTGLGWQEKLVIKILLLVARFVAVGLMLDGEQPLADEIRHLANHVQLNS